MPVRHTVEQGDSVIALATEHGHFAQTAWDDPANRELKQKREDMNALLPGDVVVIPDKRLKEVSKPQEQRHKFRRKGVPALFRIQVFDGELPRKDQDYTLDVDGKLFQGKTNGDGVLQEYVSPAARSGKLIVGKDRYTIELNFGHLDPIDTDSGVKQRLTNLGFDTEGLEGEWDDKSADAMRAFQLRFGLEATGEPDDKSIEKLAQVHDGVSTFPPVA